jgi:hypothetical protein
MTGKFEINPTNMKASYLNEFLKSVKMITLKYSYNISGERTEDENECNIYSFRLPRRLNNST